VRKTLKIVCVGDSLQTKDNARSIKAKILMNMVGKDDALAFIPTVMDEYRVGSRQVNGESVDVVISDTSGLEQFDRLRPLSYAHTNSVILMCSMHSPSSFQSVKEKWLAEIKHFCPGIPVLLVCVAERNDFQVHASTVSELEKAFKDLADSVNPAKSILYWNDDRECSEALWKASVELALRHSNGKYKPPAIRASVNRESIFNSFVTWVSSMAGSATSASASVTPASSNGRTRDGAGHGDEEGTEMMTPQEWLARAASESSSRAEESVVFSSNLGHNN